MELRHLRYFVAVGREEHFGRAAIRLKIVQPALSRQIQYLEKELGTNLFERLPHGVRLTEMGRVFLLDAERILTDVDLAIDQVQRVSRGQVGSLRVACTTWHGKVSEILRTFHSTYPNVVLNVVQLKTEEQLEALQSGSIDGGFLHRSSSDNSELIFHSIHVEEPVLAVSKSHRLAKRRNLRLIDLKNENFVWLRRSINSIQRDRLMVACLAGGLSPRIIQEVNDEAMILNLVSAGIGIAIVTRGTAWRRPQDVTVKRLRGLSAPYHLTFAWRNRSQSPILTHFLDLIRSTTSSPVGR